MSRHPGKRYLGDAVYASVEDGMIRLDCEAPPCVIYLEPGTVSALQVFIADVKAWVQDPS